MSLDLAGDRGGEIGCDKILRVGLLALQASSQACCFGLKGSDFLVLDGDTFGCGEVDAEVVAPVPSADFEGSTWGSTISSLVSAATLY